MCQQIALGFCVSLKDTFSNGTTFTVIHKYRKCAAIEIATVVSTHLSCCLSKCPMNHQFLEIYLTMLFRASIVGNTSAMMRVMFVWQMFKI